MNNTPETPTQKPDDRMDQGGNYWTLFTPRIWKVLHAVLQSKLPAGRCLIVIGTEGRGMGALVALPGLEPGRPLGLAILSRVRLPIPTEGRRVVRAGC